MSTHALSTVSMSAHGEFEIVNKWWALQSVMVPAAHALPSMRLLPPHESAAGSEAIPGTQLLVTARFHSICMAALKIVAVGEEREREGHNCHCEQRERLATEPRGQRSW